MRLSFIYNLVYISLSVSMKDVDNRILQLLHKDAMTPDDVARRLDISWSTANAHLLKLLSEGKAILLRKGRVNIYRAKTQSTHMFKAPAWIKPKPLEQLSDELEEYFPSNMTAAEMIEKERRRA